MADKVYEMYDDYYEAEGQLRELIAARDMLVESLKTAHPSRLAEGRRMLAEANAKIKACTAALKAEYDSHQAAEKSREEYDQKMGELKEGFDAAMAYLATDHPEVHQKLLAQFKEGETE